MTTSSHLAAQPADVSKRSAAHPHLVMTRHGRGAPLVLLHALGSSSHVWDRVIPTLADHFEVLSVDLPGFGSSPPLAPAVVPTPALIAAAVAAALDESDIRSPHVVGNSLGGWVALELAQLRPLASLTLLAPAGLWRGSTPIYDRVSLRATRAITRRMPRLLNRLVDHRLGRMILLGQSHGRPALMNPNEARAAIQAMGTCSGFDATLAGTTHRHYATPIPAGLAVTVAFGSRDRILLRRQSRHVERLPRTTIVKTLPGCGHIPMYDDPAAVAALIMASAARGSRSAS